MTGQIESTLPTVKKLSTRPSKCESSNLLYGDAAPNVLLTLPTNVVSRPPTKGLNNPRNAGKSHAHKPDAAYDLAGLPCESSQLFASIPASLVKVESEVGLSLQRVWRLEISFFSFPKGQNGKIRGRWLQLRHLRKPVLPHPILKRLNHRLMPHLVSLIFDRFTKTMRECTPIVSIQIGVRAGLVISTPCEQNMIQLLARWLIPQFARKKLALDRSLIGSFTDVLGRFHKTGQYDLFVSVFVLPTRNYRQ